MTGLKAIGPEGTMPITILTLTVNSTRRKRTWPTITIKLRSLLLTLPHRGDLKTNLWPYREIRVTRTTSTWANMLFKMTTCTHKEATVLTNQRVAPVSWADSNRAPTTCQLVLLRVDPWPSEAASSTSMKSKEPNP